MWIKRAGMAVGIAVLATGAVAASPAPKTMTCVMTTVSDAQGMHVNVEARVWVKGQKARVEARAPGGGSFLSLVNGSHEWRLDPSQRQGVEITHPAGEGGPQNPTDLIMTGVKRLTQGAKKLGQQKIEGYSCDVYELAHHAGTDSLTIKSWITRATQPRLPLKVELRRRIRQPNMTMDQTITTHLSELRFGVPVPDSLFQVPPGYKIVQAPAAGGPGMPGLPGMGGPGARP